MSAGATRRRLPLTVVAVAAALLLGLIASGTASAATTLRIAYNPNPTNTTIVVAQEQGYFAQNGLNVTLTASEDTAPLVSAIGKQFDLVTVTPTSVLQAAAAGLKPILVSGETYETDGLRSTYLIGGTGITSLADLKGKTVGVVGLSGVLYDSLLIQLHDAGIKASQVKFLVVPFPDMFADLQSGTIQAALTIYPFQGQMLGSGGNDLGNPIEETVHDQPMMDAGWVGYKPWIEKHLSAIKAFEKAQGEALAWLNNPANASAAQAILVNDFQIPAFVAKTYLITSYVSFGVSSSDLAPWVKPMESAGLLKKGAVKKVSSLVLGKL